MTCDLEGRQQAVSDRPAAPKQPTIQPVSPKSVHT